MSDIRCPHCQKVFKVDESDYASILSQVRTNEFNLEIERRAAEIEKQHKSAEEALKLRAEKDFESRLAAKNDEINELNAAKVRLQSEISAFESRLSAEKTALEAAKDKQMAEAVAKKEKTISDLKEKIVRQEQDIRVKVLETKDECKSEMHDKDRRIMELEAKIEADRHASENRENQLRDLHRHQLEQKQEEIDRLKDFKLKLSTKMVGESLEQHCSILFNRARSYGQFPEASFEKDNTVADGTKGDFIFRDFVEGEEYVSIMFEMKNENDTTAIKHKNEHFLEKLHKDRVKKGCEFAVLVSMLEQGNELYDEGIVDVGYRFPKMLVIRPQFFLPVIRLISEGARKGHLRNRQLLAELETARNESRDFSKFEEKIGNFVKTFGKHVKGAHDKFVAATDGIDKIIANLEKQISLLRDVKANFETAEHRLLKADGYVEENFTVKKLTHGAPSVRKLIEEARD